jgi:hypothetical protein
MPTQKREAGKNYIGLLNDKTEEQRTVEAPPAGDRHVKAYLAGLVAAMLKRNRGDAR